MRTCLLCSKRFEEKDILMKFPYRIDYTDKFPDIIRDEDVISEGVCYECFFRL